MKYIEGFNRSQTLLFPQCIDEIIPEDSEVRIIDAFVDSLPLEELGFMNHKPLEEGRPMYHPRDLFKLYIYGYLNRIRTSRLLERECERNVELMWLLKGLQPCFRTIAGFRSENPEIFRNTFRYFVAGLNKGSFLGKKVVAIDGSKFRAVNSKKNNYNQKKIKKSLSYIDERISHYIQQLDEEDLKETEREKAEQKLTHHRKQKRKYKRLEKELRESGEEQISTTDPDARSILVHGQVVEVAFNVQTVVDDKHNLVIEYEATNTNDRKALLPMSIKAKEACQVDAITVLADKGYHNGEQIASCIQEHITTYVAVPDPPRNSEIPTPEYYGEKFSYNKKKDTYTCPQGHEMKTNGSIYKRKYGESITQVKHYKTAKCKSCPALRYCTSSPTGRVIERSEHAESMEANTKRVKKHPEIYAARQEIIEHIFGTIKRQWGYDHILLKGLRKNDGEFGLIYLIYNFRRIMNILGVEEMKKWIRRLIFSILRLLHPIRNENQNLTNIFSAVRT
ncbi:MAG: IS1182 family transposase [Saprospiraceae bacterium]|uniref:IS1182 family transposase n=1 Tax=Candidatus Opimibacter skivensis TaxID=2982028 RepID=A0A9D7SRP9_9BACT|nr:IS1182 family transposase [Candidatus Opimibacter skivensis]